MAKKYTCRTSTRREPIHSFQNTMDLAAINVWVLYKEITNENLSRRDFIRILAEELAYPQVQKQNKIPGQASFTISNENDAQANKICQVKILCKRTRFVGVSTHTTNFYVEHVLHVRSVCKKCTEQQVEFYRHFQLYSATKEICIYACDYGYEHIAKNKIARQKPVSLKDIIPHSYK